MSQLLCILQDVAITENFVPSKTYMYLKVADTKALFFLLFSCIHSDRPGKKAKHANSEQTSVAYIMLCNPLNVVALTLQASGTMSRDTVLHKLRHGSL